MSVLKGFSGCWSQLYLKLWDLQRSKAFDLVPDLLLPSASTLPSTWDYLGHSSLPCLGSAEPQCITSPELSLNVLWLPIANPPAKHPLWSVFPDLTNPLWLITAVAMRATLTPSFLADSWVTAHTPSHTYASRIFNARWLYFFIVWKFLWFTNTSAVPPVGFSKKPKHVLWQQKWVLFWEYVGNLKGVSCAIWSWERRILAGALVPKYIFLHPQSSLK